MSNKKKISILAATTSVTALVAAGAFAGMAVAQSGSESVKPSYATNHNGQTYGSASAAGSVEEEPDLIRVVATNGKEGYALKVDLDLASGHTAATEFKSPDEALRWQETAGASDQTVPVYANDGKTVIGEFEIFGSETQRSWTE